MKARSDWLLKPLLSFAIRLAKLFTIIYKTPTPFTAFTLPMACILTQLSPGNKCHFLVRATDVNGRQGECSEACTITLK